MTSSYTKATPPPYEYSSLAPPVAALPARRTQCRQLRIRRRRGMKLLAISGLACLVFLVYAQWNQLTVLPSWRQSRLAADRLQEDLQTCTKLRRKPQDPIGLGRTKNARYVDGQRPILIQNATIWLGEPVEGTSLEDARAGKGYSWTSGDVFVQFGLIQKVDAHISLESLPGDTQIYDAKGRQLTAGIIDMHSHVGVSSLPDLAGTEDTNELSSDITPYVRSIDGLNPLDPQWQVIKSGGVTTSLVLPGSGNNIGGEAFVFKHAIGEKDGRQEISAADMLADPDRNWRYMKMACGENAKRVYGKVGRGPFSRLGESWEFRHAFEQAAALVRKQDDWCDQAERSGIDSLDDYLPRDLHWESLGAVLRGQVHVNTHCYTIPDLEAFIDHTNEFKFPLRAFHHAHQTFLVPEILKRAWGGRPPASALFADNMYYKTEAYVGSEYAGKILWNNGLTPVYVSDNPVINAQHVLFEAAKAYRYGLPYHVALAGVTTASAELLGLGERLGKIKPGFDADIVVWDSDPLSIGAAPAQVWIDGFAQFENPVELDKPLKGPIAAPHSSVALSGGISHHRNIVFTGVTKILLSDGKSRTTLNGPVNVVVSEGEITCTGECSMEVSVARQGPSHEFIALEDGHLTHSFTAFGSQIGLNAIDYESNTANGESTKFSRGVDGLALDTKKLRVAHQYGITRAVSAPTFSGGLTHRGTSVGFVTDAQHALEKGAVWSEDAAVHYTFTLDVKQGDTPSISTAVGALRKDLLEAVSNNDTISDRHSEQAFLKGVVEGEMPLVLTVHSADTISAVLRLKADVEDVIAASESLSTKLRIVILGGAEAHLVASELAAADVGVVLAPFQSYATSWDQRRALTGAPLTNGTAIDALIDAGVTTAIGLEEDWLIRDLALLAGIAYHNGGGRLSEKQALDLVSSNVYKLLGVKEQAEDDRHFVVFEGNPLDIGSRVRAVGNGKKETTVMT